MWTNSARIIHQVLDNNPIAPFFYRLILVWVFRHPIYLLRSNDLPRVCPKTMRRKESKQKGLKVLPALKLSLESMCQTHDIFHVHKVFPLKVSFDSSTNGTEYFNSFKGNCCSDLNCRRPS